MKPFRELLQESRIQRDMSLRHLAKIVGISDTYICRIENNQSPPPGERIVRDLANELGQDADEWCLAAGFCPGWVVGLMREKPELLATLKIEAEVMGTRYLH